MRALIRNENETVRETDGIDGIDWTTGAPLTNPAWAGGAYALCADCPVNDPAPGDFDITEEQVPDASAPAEEDGAAEVDMVINRGWVKDGLFDAVTDEIRIVKAACGDKLLKVIIECCGLTDEEKIALCKCVTDAGAEYIKTSTGFDKSGATVEDVALMKANVGAGVLVKAAGGIRTFEAAQAMIDAGADRIGASALVKLMKAEG